MAQPLVSVIIPTFNRAALVEQAIDSVLAQNWDHLELIVVDDGSRDGTRETLAQKARRDGRLRVLQAAVNGGCNRARNLAIDAARGRYIAMLDDDDLALPGRLARPISLLETHPAADVALAGYRFADARGEPRAQVPDLPGVDGFTRNSDRVFELLYCRWAWFPTSTLTFRAALFAAHRYPDIRRSDGDSMLLSRMAASGASFVQSTEPLALIRRASDHSTMSSDWAAVLSARRETLCELRTWLRSTGITRFDHLHRRAWSHHLLQEAVHAGGPRGVGTAIRALWYDPRHRAVWAHLLRQFRRRSIRGRA